METKFIQVFCAKCGGELHVPSTLDDVKCMYCGEEILIRDLRSNSCTLEELISLANIAFEQKKFEEAYKYYYQVVEIDDTNLIAWLGKARSVAWMSTVDMPRFEEAIIYIDHVKPMSVEEIELILNTIIQMFKSYYTANEDSIKATVREVMFYKGQDESIRPLVEQIIEREYEKRMSLARIVDKIINVTQKKASEYSPKSEDEAKELFRISQEFFQQMKTDSDRFLNYINTIGKITIQL